MLFSKMLTDEIQSIEDASDAMRHINMWGQHSDNIGELFSGYQKTVNPL